MRNLCVIAFLVAAAGCSKSEVQKVRDEACACKTKECAIAVGEKVNALVDQNWKNGGGASKDDMKAMDEAMKCLDSAVGK